MDLYEELFKLVEALDAVGLPYTVCGGIAVTLRWQFMVIPDLLKTSIC